MRVSPDISFSDKSHASADRLKQLLSLAEKFLHVKNYDWYWRLSFDAIRNIVNNKSLLGQFAPLKEAVCEQLTKAQNSFRLR
jgi:hypothetical protein